MQSFVKNAGLVVAFGLTTLLTFSCRPKKSDTVRDNKDSVLALGDNPYQSRDQSPLDISYCPDDYPQQKMKGLVTAPPVARVIYSRPHKKGRVIFGNEPASLCQYGKPWRLGANESTEIQFFQPVMIGGHNVDVGRYNLYCIPHADKWEIVFNSNLDSWGLHIDSTKDLFRTEVPVQSQSPSIEDFTMVFREASDGAELLMAWDNAMVLLPVVYSRQ